MELKAGGATPVGALAGSISKNLDEGKHVNIIAIGAPANNQAVKAIATASGHAGSKGKSLKIKIGFTETSVHSASGVVEDKTAMAYYIRYED